MTMRLARRSPPWRDLAWSAGVAAVSLLVFSAATDPSEAARRLRRVKPVAAGVFFLESSPSQVYVKKPVSFQRPRLTLRKFKKRRKSRDADALAAKVVEPPPQGPIKIGDTIHVDFAGTSGTSDRGINCPMCYTEAYTAFGVKCAVAPRIPNNAGSLDAIKVTAPDNTIVNAPHPCAVVARSTIGHMLPDVVFGCLHQAIPDRVPAEGTSSLWNMKLGAGHGITGSAGDGATAFTVTTFHSGGAGARPAQDGLSATPYPSGVRNVPVEITEAITPIVVWRKDYRTDSGGAGTQRGGLGQTMVIANREDAPFGIFAGFERVHFPARGRDGPCMGPPSNHEFRCPDRVRVDGPPLGVRRAAPVIDWARDGHGDVNDGQRVAIAGHRVRSADGQPACEAAA